MSEKHFTPLDREYYEAVRHANSDATTPGFFKVPPMPYGFTHRLNMLDNEKPQLESQPSEREAFEAWARGKYDLTTTDPKTGWTYGHTSTERVWDAWQARASAPHAPAPEVDTGSNYVANKEQRPTEVRFDNGRRVYIKQDGDGAFLEVEMMKPGEKWLRDAADTEDAAGFVGAGDTPYNRAVHTIVSATRLPFAPEVEKCPTCQRPRERWGTCSNSFHIIPSKSERPQMEGFEEWWNEFEPMLYFLTEEDLARVRLSAEQGWDASHAAFSSREEGKLRPFHLGDGVSLIRPRTLSPNEPRGMGCCPRRPSQSRADRVGGYRLRETCCDDRRGRFRRLYSQR
jgi:hypothetical protein